MNIDKEISLLNTQIFETKMYINTNFSIFSPEEYHKLLNERYNLKIKRRNLLIKKQRLEKIKNIKNNFED